MSQGRGHRGATGAENTTIELRCGTLLPKPVYKNRSLEAVLFVQPRRRRPRRRSGDSGLHKPRPLRSPQSKEPRARRRSTRSVITLSREFKALENDRDQRRAYDLDGYMTRAQLELAYLVCLARSETLSRFLLDFRVECPLEERAQSPLGSAWLNSSRALLSFS